MRIGDSFGRWVLVERLGGGGNGEVWQASTETATGAVKILRTDRQQRWERRARFRREIQFLLDGPDRVGVLPLIDHGIEDSPPWYAMPVVLPLSAALGPDPVPEAVVAAIEPIARTLAALSEEGIGHRDIKPENLFDFDGSPVIGDFGLVTYPEADPITRAGRRLGPIDYMAPEMREHADESHHEPADVYALAKTLWVMLTGQNLPLPGPHRLDDPAFALASRLEHPWTIALDSLISRATRIEPGHRPSMAEFYEELSVLLPSGRHRASLTGERRAVGERLNRLAEGEQARAATAADIERRLNQASGPPHDVLQGAFAELEGLLPNWVHSRDSGNAVPAYRLMGEARAFWGQRGRVDSFSIERPRTDGRRVTIALSVGVRLDAEGEILTIAGGVQLEDGCSEPEWLRSVSVDVPLSSSLEIRPAEQLREALMHGIDEALGRAENLLLG